MLKGSRVQNLISGRVGTLVNGNFQDPPLHLTGSVAVYSVRLDNGQYRYWSYKNVSQL